MIEFDENKQLEKLKRIKKSEEEDLAQLLSEKYGVPYLDMVGIPVNTDALKIISEKVARENNLAIFGITGKILDIVVVSMGNEKTLASLRDLREKKYKLNIFIVSKTSLDKILSSYKEIIYASKTKRGLLDVSNKDIEDFISKTRTINEARETIKKNLGTKNVHRITKVLETILASGISLEASDIHIEPEEDAVKIRFRLDGVLNQILEFDSKTYKLVLSRIKLLSGLKISTEKNAQDGRFSVHINNVEIEIRTSTIPSEYGESIVLRILNPSTISVPLEELGMEPSLLKTIQKELGKPNGMLLNTGPTGSGKTTTLYAFLKTVRKEKSKVITIENPIEYHLEGIVQTQVNKEKEYTFAKGLRSILRQDPDVIMVGEIRNEETAEVAINAALTGHLVFSTLHTNNAAGTFPRLIDLDTNPQIIGSAINVAMAQRLVRKLCNYCKKEIPVSGEKGIIIDKVLKKIEEKGMKELITNKSIMWKAVGCKECENTGYKGRIGLFEAILVDEEIEKIIKNNPSETEIKKASAKQKILNMQQDGVLKILKGITDFDELARIIEIKV